MENKEMNKEEIYAKVAVFGVLIITIFTLHSLQAYYYYKDKVDCQQSNGYWQEYHNNGLGLRWECIRK